LATSRSASSRTRRTIQDCDLGDLIVGIVRRPDPVPCRFCAAGEWDMCANGRYTERGIKEHDGYCAEHFRIEPAFTVKVDPALGELGVLLEPASVVAKAWDHAERIGRRSRAWEPRTALVTGAGPIGLLASLMGRQRGLAVHVYDRASSGPKPELVRASRRDVSQRRHLYAQHARTRRRHRMHRRAFSHCRHVDAQRRIGRHLPCRRFLRRFHHRP
jgi:D-arabinose 1-dehydrogenase-like Zn-dependent alcohol dehydrogenase